MSVEDLAAQVVSAIAQCIDHLRTIDSFRENVRPKATTELEHIPVFTKLKEETDLLSRVAELSHAVADAIPENKDLSGPITADAENSKGHDYERAQLVHKIIVPLLTALGRCYSVLDRLSNPLPSPDSSASSKPPPPIGMLSLRNYTDIACLVELAVCSSILPLVDPWILVTAADRVRHILPKALAGRIPRPSLLWATQCRCRAAAAQQANKTRDELNQDRIELLLVSSVIGSLVLLDRFRPMLLPRHVSDLYAAILQAEMLTANRVPGPDQRDDPQLQLPIDPANKAVTIDPILQAKAYQSLLMHGTKAPVWFRQRVSLLLADLARRDLLTMIHVFVHAASTQNRTAAGLRLARALVSEQPKHNTSERQLYFESICRQVQSILQAVYMEYGSLSALMKSRSRQHETTVHAVWATLDVIPPTVRDQYWLGSARQNMLVTPNNNTNSVATAQIHQTVVQLGTLLCSVPPCSDPFMLCRLVLMPVEQTEEGLPPTIFGMLLRLATLSTVLKSQVKEDTVTLLQSLRNTFLAAQFRREEHPENNVRGVDVFGVALVYALAPCQWDLGPFRYKKSTCSSNDGEIILVEEIDTVGGSRVEHIAREMEQRAHVMMKSLFVTAAENANNKIRSLFSLVFALLLQMYFTAEDGMPNQIRPTVPEIFRSPHFQLVPLACIPILCEDAKALSLLASDSENDTCIFDIMIIVFRSMASHFADKDFSVVPEASDKEGTVQSYGKVEVAASYFSSLLSCRIPKGSLLVDPGVSGDSDIILLSTASALLSILISVLELGARRRSQRDEDMFASFIPLLRPLAELPVEDITESAALRSTLSEFAEMASHATALLASRNFVDSNDRGHATKQSTRPATPAEKLAQAQEDLKSTDPPIRARGVVLLRHLAMAYTDERVNLDGKSDSFVEKLLLASVTALGDSESYVYLAAVHTIVAIADTSPSSVLPLLNRALALGAFPRTDQPDVHLTSEQRIKLAEALIFAIRRRGAISEYVPFLIECMLFGPRNDNSSQKPEFAEAIVIQRRTHNYFLEGRHTTEDAALGDADEAPEKNWEEIDVRVKAGGPLFLTEEDDAASASLLSVVSELIAACQPPVLARFSSSIIKSTLHALQMDTSRPVRRAGAYMAMQLYSALLREEFSLELTSTDIPLAVSLIAGDEDKLHVALQRCFKVDDLDDLGSGKRVYDPATVARCEEALNMRKRASNSGILAAARLCLDAQRKHSNNPVAQLLEKSNSKPDSLIRGIMIEEMD